MTFIKTSLHILSFVLVFVLGYLYSGYRHSEKEEEGFISNDEKED